MKKQPVNPDQQEEKEDEEEMEESCGTKKSVDLTEEDLMKSVEQLESFTTQADPEARKKSLLHKALNEDLTDDESSELMGLMKGEAQEEEIVEEPIAKSLEENEEIQKSMEVSSFLNEMTGGVINSLNEIGNRLEKSETAQHQFNLVLAKAITSVGKMAKSISSRLETIENAPARAPKSQGPKALEKSFGGHGPQAPTLTKSDILDTMISFVQNPDLLKGRNTTGVNFVNEIAKFEQTGKISPQAYKLIAAQTVN